MTTGGGLKILDQGQAQPKSFINPQAKHTTRNFPLWLAIMPCFCALAGPKLQLYLKTCCQIRPCLAAYRLRGDEPRIY